MNPRWAVHLEHLRRRWALVLVVAIVAGAASVAALLADGPSFTGRAALVIVSQNRSPDQDAVLGRGYVDLFNQPSLQSEYARRNALGDDVTFSARLAAGTPVLYVETVAADPGVAGRAATALAVTLRDDVRNNVAGDRVEAAAGLSAQLESAQARLAALSPTSPDRSALIDQINALQSQLSTVQANTTNQLRDLQLDAGVTENPRPIPRTAVVAVLGGALLGGLAALLLGAAGPGLGSPTEIRARLDLDVLAALDRADPPEETDRALARVLAHPDLPRPTRLAVATAGTGADAADAGSARAWVAASLARLAVRQGGTALLLRADVAGDARTDELGTRPGVSDVLARPGAPGLEGVVLRDAHGVLAVPPGTRRTDLYAVFSRERTPVLLAQAQSLADVVVVDAPAVADPGDAGTVVCGGAEGTVLVLTARTRAADARAALDAITRAGGGVLGVVTVADGRTGEAATDRTEAAGWEPALRPTPAVSPRPTTRPAATTPAPTAGTSREPAHALLRVRPSPTRPAP